MARNAVVEAWVDRFVDDRDNQYVTERHIERASGILRLIGKDASERGFVIPPPQDDGLRQSHHADVAWAHIVIVKEDATYFLRLQELCAPNAPRRDPSDAGADASMPRWLADRVREFIGTGLLQLSIRADGDMACRKTAKDTMTSSLEEKIPSVLDEFVAAAERRRKDREERAEWERIKERARERFDSDCLMACVDRQAEQYLAMAKRREYLSALERSLEQYKGEDYAEAAGRVAMLRERVDAEDPGLHPERLEFAIPEPTDAQLETYMDGWSAAGPYHISPYARPYGREQRAGTAWSAGSDGYCRDEPAPIANGFNAFR